MKEHQQGGETGGVACLPTGVFYLSAYTLALLIITGTVRDECGA